MAFPIQIAIGPTSGGAGRAIINALLHGTWASGGTQGTATYIPQNAMSVGSPPTFGPKPYQLVIPQAAMFSKTLMLVTGDNVIAIPTGASFLYIQSPLQKPSTNTVNNSNATFSVATIGIKWNSGDTMVTLDPNGIYCTTLATPNPGSVIIYCDRAATGVKVVAM